MIVKPMMMVEAAVRICTSESRARTVPRVGYSAYYRRGFYYRLGLFLTVSPKVSLSCRLVKQNSQVKGPAFAVNEQPAVP